MSYKNGNTKTFYLSIIFTISYTIVFSQDIVINEFMSSNHNTIADHKGKFSDWIELYNTSDSPINLKDYKLSDDIEDITKWSFPAVIMNPYSYLLVFASDKEDNNDNDELHTNFKIKSSGEYIILSNSSNVILDSIPPTFLAKDKSYGLLNDNNLGYLASPTPNSSNSGIHFESEITFSHNSGFYPDSFNLTLNSEDQIYYTLDGTEPSINSILYTNPILISASKTNKLSLIPTTFLEYLPDVKPNKIFGFQLPKNIINEAVVIKSASFKNEELTGKTYCRTYFTKENKHKFSIISIITDSLSLFDKDTGIYVPGTNFDENDKNWSGNYYQRGKDWERKANIDFFDNTGKLAFSETVGLRVVGNKSRSAPQKSIRLYFREDYGKSSINYPFFKDRDYSDFKRLTLRSSFTFWWGRNTLFQDDILHAHVAQSGFEIDHQQSLPNIVFINGEYWGIHNIRERQDKNYLSSIHNIDDDEVDIIKGNLSAEEGTADDFIDIINFVGNNDLSVTHNYDNVKDRIDINNFIDYNIIQTFYGNTDWPGNNIKMWREQKNGAKWRWILYDLDAAIPNVLQNPFEGINNSNSKHSTLFKNLIKNEEFKTDFINRYIYHLQTTFDPQRIEELSSKFKAAYLPELQQHIARWNIPIDQDSWEYSCNYFDKFVKERPCVIKTILIDQFDLENFDDFDCLYSVNLEKDSIKNVMKIFPNPNSGQFYVLMNLKRKINGTITIFNSLGKSIYSSNINNLIHRVNLNSIANGIYFVRIDSKHFQTIERVIIQ